MGTAEQDDFDSYRDLFVERIERARESQSEEELAEVLSGISEAAGGDLERRSAEGHVDEDTVVAVNAWTSVHSYAIARFYFEGPESLFRKGGYSERVASELQRAVDTFGSYLRTAVASTGASAFSISVGFPFGVSIALEWSA